MGDEIVRLFTLEVLPDGLLGLVVEALGDDRGVDRFAELVRRACARHSGDDVVLHRGSALGEDFEMLRRPRVEHGVVTGEQCLLLPDWRRRQHVEHGHLRVLPVLQQGLVLGLHELQFGDLEGFTSILVCQPRGVGLGEFRREVGVPLVLGEDRLGLRQRQTSCVPVRLDSVDVRHHFIARDGEHPGQLLAVAQRLHDLVDLLVDLTPNVVLLGVVQEAGCVLLFPGDTTQQTNTHEL